MVPKRFGYGVASLFALAAGPIAKADDMAAMATPVSASAMGHMLPHPFLSHMGLPDEPGSLSVRVAAYRQGRRGEPSWTDGAFHLEAGLLNRLGLHVRTDAVMQDPRLDIMLMFAALKDREGASGVSIFAAGEVPAGAVPSGEKDVESAFGLAGRKTFGDAATFDADVHYMPTMKMFEYEAAAVGSVSGYFYPVVEFSGEYFLKQETMPASSSLYVLPAVKFKLKAGVYLGVGVQTGITETRDFDNRALLQLDSDW